MHDDVADFRSGACDCNVIHCNADDTALDRRVAAVAVRRHTDLQTRCEALRVLRILVLGRFRYRRARYLERFVGPHGLRMTVSYGGNAFLPGRQIGKLIDEGRAARVTSAKEPHQVITERIRQSGMGA